MNRYDMIELEGLVEEIGTLWLNKEYMEAKEKINEMQIMLGHLMYTVSYEMHMENLENENA